MGTSHESLGDQYAALSSYKQSLLLNPKLPHSYNNMAAIHRALGADAVASGNQRLAREHIGRAKHFWRQAISLSPHSFPEAVEWLASHRNHEVKADEIIDEQMPLDEPSSSRSIQSSDLELNDLIDQARQSMQRINLSNDT
jgi:tetratricopeptide (TPR) repeat protein